MFVLLTSSNQILKVADASHPWIYSSITALQAMMNRRTGPSP
jgi:hypothetical protein